MLIDPSKERLGSIRDCLATFVSARREDEVLDEAGIRGFALLEVIQAKAETGVLGSQFATPSADTGISVGPGTSANAGTLQGLGPVDAFPREWPHRRPRCVPVLIFLFPIM
jgi:hypothetical protein